MQLESFLEQSACRQPEKLAVACGQQRLSYAEVEQAANRLAKALIARGVNRGDRIVLHLDNSVETVISIFAVLKAGGVFCMVNPGTKSDKLTYVLNDCRATALCLPASKLATHESCWQQTPHLRALVVTGSAAPPTTVAGKTCLAWNDAQEEQAGHDQPPAKRAIDIDLAALVYTSGSTGNPKGVMLSHQNMVAAATSITTYLENRAEDIILSVLPLAFDYGLYQVLMSVKFGGTVILERSFAYPQATLNRLAEQRVTGFPLVPTMLAVLLQMDLTKHDLSALRYVTNTGAALPLEHIRRFRELLPHVALYSMYGLTECKRVAYLPPEQIDIRPGSVGKAMPNCEVLIVDGEGRPRGAGETGELVVRGGNVMQGYWERPEETARVLKQGSYVGDRLLYTGDLFRHDEEGYLYFVGRRDDIIKSRGEKVSPREVENVLCAHPGVSEAAVLGVPDEMLGRAIKAVVALRAGAQLTAQQLRRHCAERLEEFMVPQVVEIRATLPKTGNGKIDKSALEQETAGVSP